MLVRDTPATAQEAGCIIPACSDTGDTCQIWGKRTLCYPHFAAFSVHPLSAVCSDNGRGPTPAEWDGFVRGLSAKQEAA